MVTRPGGVPCGAPCWSGPLTSASNASYRDVALAKLRISPRATSLDSDHGAAENWESSAVRPTGLPMSWGITPCSRRTRGREARRERWKRRSSDGLQNPPGSRATVLPPIPRRASSSTIRAPIELPTVSTSCSPSARRYSATASVSRSIVTSPSSGALSPKPGRSIAMTSRERARSSRMGLQDAQLAPRPWTRSSGCPLPRRVALRVPGLVGVIPPPYVHGFGPGDTPLVALTLPYDGRGPRAPRWICPGAPRNRE